MSKTMLPIAAALFSFYAAVALLGGSAGGQAAVVEHTFVVSREMHICPCALGQACNRSRSIFSFSRFLSS
jgi:hypothetical protein